MSTRWWILVLGALGLAAGAPRCSHPRCVRTSLGDGDYEYSVREMRVWISFSEGSSFRMSCEHWDVAALDALPAFDSEQRVARADVTHCGRGEQPAERLAALLAALNVTVLDELTLRANLSRVSAPLLAGLRVTRLRIYAAGADLEPDAFSGLARLTKLDLVEVAVGWAALHSLPGALLELDVKAGGITSIDAEWFRRRPRLQALILSKCGNVTVEARAAAGLRILLVSASEVSVRWERSERLTRLALEGVGAARAAHAACAALPNLDTLEVKDPEPIPSRWLTECMQLHSLRLRLQPPPATTAAFNASSGTFIYNKLRDLPVDLLEYTPHLSSLDLAFNLLPRLPPGLFAPVTRTLRSLRLQNNRFDNTVLEAVAGLTLLSDLNLSNNPRLDGGCGQPDGVNIAYARSPLHRLSALTSLSLAGTSVTRICTDWRQNMPKLETLDLRRTNITSVTLAELMHTRDVTNASVLLDTHGRIVLESTEQDYYSFKRLPYAKVYAGVRCDCRAYWASLVAVETRGDGLHFLDGVECQWPTRPYALSDAPHDLLVCNATDKCQDLPACRCVARHDRLYKELVTANCSHANLTELPKLPSAAGWRLLVPFNNITHLRTADLPRRLRELDVRNNSIVNLEVEVAAVPKLHLEGNPLECGCEAAGVLEVLRKTHPHPEDLAGVTCAGGLPLRLALEQHCEEEVPDEMVWVVAGASVGVVVVVLAVAAACWRGAPALVKRALERLGWAAPAPASLHFRYDVFVSFAHEDEQWVVEELARRLERAGRRLCMHHRDWAPGEWIPAQIAASVRVSRRTLAVVSTHFARSVWARAEFREAYAASLRASEPRLVVVLTADPATLPLDPELRDFLSRNTYLRTDDLWFWNKLLAALPPNGPNDSCSVARGVAAHSPKVIQTLSPAKLLDSAMVQPQLEPSLVSPVSAVR